MENELDVFDCVLSKACVAQLHAFAISQLFKMDVESKVLRLQDAVKKFREQEGELKDYFVRVLMSSGEVNKYIIYYFLFNWILLLNICEVFKLTRVWAKTNIL